MLLQHIEALRVAPTLLGDPEIPQEDMERVVLLWGRLAGQKGPPTAFRYHTLPVGDRTIRVTLEREEITVEALTLDEALRSTCILETAARYIVEVQVRGRWWYGWTRAAGKIGA